MTANGAHGGRRSARARCEWGAALPPWRTPLSLLCSAIVRPERCPGARATRACGVCVCASVAIATGRASCMIMNRDRRSLAHLCAQATAIFTTFSTRTTRRTGWWPRRCRQSGRLAAPRPTWALGHRRAQVGITAERASTLDFSVPTYDAGVSLLVSKRFFKSQSSLAVFADLRGNKRVCGGLRAMARSRTACRMQRAAAAVPLTARPVCVRVRACAAARHRHSHRAVHGDLRAGNLVPRALQEPGRGVGPPAGAAARRCAAGRWML